ncbi:MAG: OsmC family protein [Bacteroidota bacterium]
MDPIIEVKYIPGLRTESTHLRSGVAIVTDAPVDNNGKGESFSPTDLVCSALASCMMTIMGILAEREGIDLTGLKADVIKLMSANPRKIAGIRIHLTHPGLVATDEQKEKLRRAALTCPVALSLGETVTQEITFGF